MEKIVIAISGGIDSLVAAYCLRRMNISVMGINFITGFEENPNISYNEAKFAKISNRLKIPIEIVDIRSQFKSNVIDYFIDTYCMGKTPNPCLICNKKIKFGLLANMAKKIGASKIATGHYARIEENSNGKVNLKRGVDKIKDQSYFLSRLDQNQLSNAIFPIGNMRKAQVIKIASENNLKPTTSKESQDICFTNGKKYSDFINKIGGSTFKSEPGKIVDTEGKYLGLHNGLHHFTIGQRRGINCPNSQPYYVVKIDKSKNHLIVGRKQELYSSTCIVRNVNWVSHKLKKTTMVNTKIRYKSPSSLSLLTPMSTNSVKIVFEIPQLAITPGQAAVFYIGNRVIGSGWIETSE